MKFRLLMSMFLFALLSGCNNLYIPTIREPSPYAPHVPAGLAAEQAIVSMKAIIPKEEWRNVYGKFLVVPEIGNNYNRWIDNISPIMKVLFEDPTIWKPSTNSSYPKETSTDLLGGKYPSIIRANEDFSEYELYISQTSEEIRYLRVNQKPTYSHALLLMYHTSGNDAHDSVEIIKTNTKIITKCVRIHNITSPITTLQHFVAITDLSTTNKNTTGLRKAMYGDSTFTFFDMPLASAEYFNSEQGGSLKYLHAYFDDERNRISFPDSDRSGFPDPYNPLLTGIFDQGIDTVDIGHMYLDGAAGTGGFELSEWAPEYLD